MNDELDLFLGVGRKLTEQETLEQEKKWQNKRESLMYGLQSPLIFGYSSACGEINRPALDLFNAESIITGAKHLNVACKDLINGCQLTSKITDPNYFSSINNLDSLHDWRNGTASLQNLWKFDTSKLKGLWINPTDYGYEVLTKELILDRRIESLWRFIEFLEKQEKVLGLPFGTFNRDTFRCTRATILKALQKWELRVDKPKKRNWKPFALSSFYDFWDTKERRNVCRILKDPNRYDKDFFKIFGL